MNNLTLKKVFYFVPVAFTLFTAIYFLSGHTRIWVKIGDPLWHPLIVYLIIALFYIVLYCIHVSKNRKIEKPEKRLWYAGIILSSGIVSTIYYFMHILKEDKTQ